MYKIPRTGSAWCTGRGSLRIGLGGKAACQWGPGSRSPGGAAEEQTRLQCFGDAHPVLSRPGQYRRLLRTVVYVCLQRRLQAPTVRIPLPPEVSSPVLASEAKPGVDLPLFSACSPDCAISLESLVSKWDTLGLERWLGV